MRGHMVKRTVKQLYQPSLPVIPMFIFRFVVPSQTLLSYTVKVYFLAVRLCS